MSAINWPVESAFEDVDLNAGPADDPVICSISRPARAVNCILSLSVAFCQGHGIATGDRFKVSAAETSSAFYIKLTPHKTGGAQLTEPPSRKKGGVAGRLLIRLGRCGGVDLPARLWQAVEYRPDTTTLDRKADQDGPAQTRLNALTIRVPKGDHSAEAGKKAGKAQTVEPMNAAGRGALAAVPPSRSTAPCPKDSPAAVAARRFHRQGMKPAHIALKVSEEQNVVVDASFVDAAIAAGND